MKPSLIIAAAIATAVGVSDKVNGLVVPPDADLVLAGVSLTE
jgi:hypothetical protein